jgi:hypothetical protein
MARTSLSLVAVCLMTAIGVGCGDKSAPTSATPIETPTPPTTPSPAVPGKGDVQVSVNPNPVPFSGEPITDAAGCAALKNTWFYEHVFTETNGVQVKFTARVDSFDGFVINNLSGLDLVVPAKGTLRIKARWCSGNGVNHEAQSSFSGTDANGNAITLVGPKVRLMAPAN